MICLPNHLRRLLLKSAFITILILAYSSGNAQYYNIGQDPASLKWRIISTPHLKIIYPSDFENNAQRLANLFEYVNNYGTRTLACKPSRIPVIVHNRDITPNAFTLWAPKRIELFSCPPQNTYSQDWLEQLAIHEYRHIAQMEMVNHGFTRGMNWILGQQATALVTGCYIPMWFMEGDAVCTETALSHSGRGRVPAFEMDIRAQVLEKGIYSYDKAVMGSYKDFIPDQYALGYQIVADTRKNFGSDSWVKAIDEVARKPYSIVPFNRGLKKSTGLGKKALYKKTLSELDSAWRSQAEATHLTPYRVISRSPGSVYSKYKFPHYINDSLILAEKTTNDDITRFVLIDLKGNEKIVCTPGFYSADALSVNTGNKPGTLTADNISINKGLMTWTERESDPRWQNRNYSVIKLFDFSKQRIRSLTHNSRLFVPCLSPDSKSLVAVKVTEDNVCSLVIIDLLNPRNINEILTSGKELYLTPSFSDDGKTLVFLIMNEQGKAICTLDLNSGKIRQEMAPSFTEISNPRFIDRYIFFNAAYSGIDNIYALDTTNHTVYQVTSSAFGAIDAEYSRASNKLVYCDYNSTGYRIVETPFTPERWLSLSNVVDRSVSLYKSLIVQESGIVDTTTLTSSVFNSRPYHKAAHLFNFHSWAPVYFNYEKSESSGGISLMSQNQLSTATTIAGYDWDYAGKVGRYRLTFKYEGFYPIIDLDAGYGQRAFTEFSGSDSSHRFTWDETALSAGLRLPLVYNLGKYFMGVQFSANSSWIKVKNNTSLKEKKPEGTYDLMEYRVYLYHFIKQANKDVYPRWGQILDFNLNHSPLTGSGELQSGSVAGTLFFPGFIRHHGIRLYAGYQLNSGTGYYSRLIEFPRGIITVNNKSLLSFKMNYKFPFLYPDASLGPVVYLKRFKANLFYDGSAAWINGNNRYYDSAGIELTSDMHLLRFLLPFDLGIRQGYSPALNTWFTDFLFTMSLNF